MQTVIVVGSWSSGTTAVTGYLSRLGGYTCPPTIQTSDPRTPDSHESVEFRHAVADVHDEMTLSRIGEPADFAQWFAPWLSQQHKRAALNGGKFVLLKHPLSALVLAEIQKICSPRIVVVTRPYAAIENTRQRRGWGPSYGIAGAKVIYSRAFSTLIEQGISFMSVDFNDFRTSKAAREELTQYCGLVPSERAEAAADAWVK
jgi:hypothetical protein